MVETITNADVGTRHTSGREQLRIDRRQRILLPVEEGASVETLRHQH
jgi:hypothetical protein